jgi:hypothetical protein
MRKKGSAPAYKKIEAQAQAVLRQIQKDIREREKELTTLRDQEQKLESMFGKADGSAPSAARGGSHRSPGYGRRTDWGAILVKLPKQFKAADIRKAPQISRKRPSEIFAAITRWINAKQVKRKDRGVYERMG